MTRIIVSWFKLNVNQHVIIHMIQKNTKQLNIQVDNLSFHWTLNGKNENQASNEIINLFCDWFPKCCLKIICWPILEMSKSCNFDSTSFSISFFKRMLYSLACFDLVSNMHMALKCFLVSIKSLKC
jgi:hypothetical protein